MIRIPGKREWDVLLSMIATLCLNKTMQQRLYKSMFTFSWRGPLLFLPNMHYDRVTETVLVNEN